MPAYVSVRLPAEAIVRAAKRAARDVVLGTSRSPGEILHAQSNFIFTSQGPRGHASDNLNDARLFRICFWFLFMVCLWFYIWFYLGSCLGNDRWSSKGVNVVRTSVLDKHRPRLKQPYSGSEVPLLSSRSDWRSGLCGRCKPAPRSVPGL